MKQSDRVFGPIFDDPACTVEVGDLFALFLVSSMGWMDLSEYVLIEGAARDRLLDLLPAVVPRRVNAAGAPMSTLATALYVASALRVQPRAIDRYTDYLGDRVLHER